MHVSPCQHPSNIHKQKETKRNKKFDKIGIRMQITLKTGK